MATTVVPSPGRQLRRGLGELAPALPLFLFAPLVRRWHMRWGATDGEVAAPMPGDEIVPVASMCVTRAITINAPPEKVWPWLVQVGFGRAGFYSYDLLDNAARPSADSVIPELQELTVGRWVPMASKVNETTAFKVQAFALHEWLLWTKPHSTWAWKLVRVDGDRTRLITRLKNRYDWRRSPGNAVLSVILMEFGDFPMMRKMLHELERRIERAEADR